MGDTNREMSTAPSTGETPLCEPQSAGQTPAQEVSSTNDIPGSADPPTAQQDKLSDASTTGSTKHSHDSLFDDPVPMQDVFGGLPASLPEESDTANVATSPLAGEPQSQYQVANPNQEGSMCSCSKIILRERTVAGFDEEFDMIQECLQFQVVMPKFKPRKFFYQLLHLGGSTLEETKSWGLIQETLADAVWIDQLMEQSDAVEVIRTRSMFGTVKGLPKRMVMCQTHGLYLMTLVVAEDNEQA
jgi:hypothetical protein